MFSPFTQTDNKYRDAGSPSNMEPMSLGSPVSSPKNRASTSQNYLPPYLFGEAVSSPVGSPAWNTPQKSNITAFQSPSSFISTPVSQFREQQVSYQSPSSNSMINTPNPTKSGGPPTQGLLYSTTSHSTSFNSTQLDNTPSMADRLVSEGHNFSGVMSPNRSLCVTNTSYLSPAQIDPFFTQGEALKNSEQLDESWVTVYGFPLASSSYVVQQFSQCGNIIEQKASSGNWIHLRYQSKLQAKKALSKSGKVLSGNIMIGVKPCIEMNLMGNSKENSVHDTVLLPGQDSLQTETLEPTKPNLKNIRHLTQAYQSPNPQTEVTTRSGSIISKALEYIWKSD